MIDNSEHPERVTLRRSLSDQLRRGDNHRLGDIAQISSSLISWGWVLFNHQNKDLIMNTPFMSSDFAFTVSQISLVAVGGIGMINGVMPC